MGFLIFISLLVFSLGTYLIWPSRQNVTNHLGIGFAFVAYFVPAIMVGVTDDFPPALVELYTEILVYGAIAYTVGLFIGFNIKRHRTALSFEVLQTEIYERRVMKLTRVLVLMGIIGLVISFIGMGFLPIFASDPISAKFFRGAYQAPYQKVAVIYRSSLFILSSIIPVAIIIWYKTRSKLYLWLTLFAVILITLTLLRSLAFTGMVFAFAIIMSFKTRKRYFYILLTCLISIYTASALFYFIIGVRDIGPSRTGGLPTFWETIASGSPDIEDQLNFLKLFNENPVWTYGRTWVGGLIPGHYKWNPGVYTLNIVVKDADVNEIDSGGLRLPVAMWGYVSFEWIGVVFVCFMSGLLKGWFVRYIKKWIETYDSIIIKTVVFLIMNSLFTPLSDFYTLSMYSFPIIAILLFYMYRFKSRNQRVNYN